MQSTGQTSTQAWSRVSMQVWVITNVMGLAFLRPSLDIPYCHHEKWDGSGYPRKLAGNEIPLSARIFAVVDVWDALRSDRTYRLGWPEDTVLDYIRDQAGAHFDPHVAAVFLALISRPDAF